MKLPALSQVSKAVAALAAGVTTMVTAGLITGSMAVWVSGATTAVLVALATFSAPANRQP